MTEKEIETFKQEFLEKNYDNWGSHTDYRIRIAVNGFCELLIKKFIKKEEVKL